MKLIYTILLIGIISGQDLYEQLIQEKVSEEYCKSLIGNISSILKEGYVFLDFLKSPIQPKGFEDYIPTVDLIKELNEINITNRTFYDFYREVQEVLEKTRDGHLSFYAEKTPNNFDLASTYFCIPFKYYIHEIFSENQEVKEVYLSIEPIDSCKEGFSEEVINRIKYLKGKKIISINDIDPYVYLENMGKKGMVVHSPQARYIVLSWYISSFNPKRHPFKKEELKLLIKFDGEEEVLNIEYQFQQKKFFSPEFKAYFISEQEKYTKMNIPFPNFEQMELKYRIKKGLISKNMLKDGNKFWDLQNKDGIIKCKIDNDNQLNVLYQSGFSPEDFDDYNNIMYQCFSKFYSNDYKIIVIEDQNPGGYTELSIPATQFTRPKILKPTRASSRSTNLLYEEFFRNDENINTETCLAYTEKDNILEGTEDKYSKDVNHKKTKYHENLNIFEKKIMDLKNKEFAKTGKTKKPSEIIVFTDGFSFSCGSIYIRELQINGGAIIAGYNIRPDLVNTTIDASQSNSVVSTYSYSEYIKNLKKLGFNPKISMGEFFDFNEQGTPKIPMEFLIYPVDTIVNIYKKYSDENYDRFIKEAKKIFDKYNNLDKGECNPNNKYLFFETKDCDSIINVEHAHGGYLCGSNGKWNKSNCIASYCDEGYILNDQRTQCIKNPCDSIKLNEISIKEENETQYNIEPNNIYIFKIENENFKYSFNSNLEPFFYIYNDDHILESAKNNTMFKYRDKIYVNYYTNITNIIEIKITPEKEENKNDNNEPKDLSRTSLILIIIGSIVLVLLIIIVIIFVISKKKNISSSEIEDKTQQLNPL
jgi:hypothetical protein